MTIPRIFSLAGPVLLAVVLAQTAPAVNPTPIYQTYVPGYTIPHARDVVVDDAGNAYLIGSAHDDGQHLDVLVAKFDPAGDLVWTRYIIGNNHCYATGLAVNSEQDVWVTGWTDASDFPTVNAMDASLTGFRDIFLMKLGAADGAILYSTYVGGDYTDLALGMALNDADEIFLTGYTGSTDFPVTEDAYQPTPNFPEYFYKDAIIVKLSPAGDQILYATYFGGTHDDQAQQIALDGAGNVIIAGYTDADDMPLVNAVQSSPDDMFVSKLSADGSTLLFSTYLGGEDIDRTGRMVSDGAGTVYLVGTTRSTAFPTTTGAFQETFVGEVNGCEVPFGQDYNCEDLFVTKLATDGDGIQWSTYLGGTRVEEGRGIAVDGAGRVYVTGYTGSADFPPSGMDFGAEIIVSRFAANGGGLDYTYSIDSGSANRGNGITVDASGNVYFTGTVGVPASIYISKLGGETINVAQVDSPARAHLNGNFPNPFNPGTRISFELDAPSPVRLVVYDMAGHAVRSLMAGAVLTAGLHEIQWDGRDDAGRPLAGGVFLYRLEAGNRVETGRMAMVK